MTNNFQSLLQGVYGVKVVLTGDNVPHPENALIIINHPTRTDWNFLWAGLHHLAPSHNAKIILKEEVKKIPGLGWIMSMSRFIYLKRKWSEDKIIIDNMLDYFADIRYECSTEKIELHCCWRWSVPISI